MFDWLFGKKKTVTNVDNIKASEEKDKSLDLSGDVGSIKTIFDEEEEKQKRLADKRNGKAQDTSKKKIKKTRKALIKMITVPKYVQDSIPYVKVFLNGIIKTKDDIYTKSYKITDTNFRTATQEVQNEIFFAYGELLNYFQPDVRPQFVIWSHKIDQDEFKREVLYQKKNDKFDVYREDLNNILREKISEGQNSIVQDKYLIISVKAENVEIANGIFSRIDAEISSKLKTITDYQTDPMELQERLELLYNIYNQDTDIKFFKKMNIDGKEARSFSIPWLLELGLTTKDAIGPNALTFERDYMRIGDKYARSLYLRNLPTELSAEIFTSISEIGCNCLTSVHYAPYRQDEAIKLVRNRMIDVSANVAQSAQRLAKQGLTTEFISPDLQEEKEGADSVYKDLTVRDQKAFLMAVTVTIFADDLEELNKYTEIAINKAGDQLCTLAKLTEQQEKGLNTTLPLGVKEIYADRFMNTVSAALFLPFSSQELIQKGGNYYGINETSHNMIMYNRLRGQNSNGLILGMSGSGKSFAAKAEMTQVFLKDPTNEIFVIDPQAEYAPLANALGGEVIRITPGSSNHINPFDLDITADEKDGDDPITVKSNYICSIFESAIGGRNGLNTIQVTIIDRCVRLIYEDYIAEMTKRNVAIDEENEEIERYNRHNPDNEKPLKPRETIDTTICPTMTEFYELIKRQPEPEAEYIALAIEKYCIGNFRTFSYQTNVNTNSRFTVYDISAIKAGSGMGEMGMQVCLNDIWNRTIRNKGKCRTFIYIDELYMITQSESCARFLMYVFKQIRKYGGVPTGMTQNCEDLLTNRESRGIFNNCSFIMMMNQSLEDRMQIGSLLHLSESQLGFIKNADSGHGLLYTGKSIVPFANIYPRDNELYTLLSTNPNDIKKVLAKQELEKEQTIEEKSA
ncbi:MAG: DUF87 domain-containing protein [Oribacterium sp.]|nr:DUF87 domain-containing protein [Oribacterium sp.]